MTRGKGFRRAQMERAKARTKRKLESMWKWSPSEITAKDVGKNATVRCRCSCDWCQPEHWTLRRAGRQAEARTEDEMMAINEGRME